DDNMPYEKDGVGELPHLSEMARAALEILETDPDGFFLMIEGGRIDHAGHENDIERLGPEVAEFDRAVQVALEWAKGREDTLILVTADHETGGLKLPRTFNGEWPPPARWLHTNHTSTPVAIYAQGPNAQLVRDGLDNTDVFRILGGCPVPQP
ncbi:MAG: alkaline phosphatase, partial [Chrysiogenetes bacterium]|nr:alkaline phosphatase [Chrysiogenetes bacterium]